jgi:zinc/manganese transport system substrate-binding protein
MPNTLPLVALVPAFALVLSGCVAAVQPAAETESAPTESSEVVTGPTVVTTTTVLGSVVSDILVCAVGDDASLSVLMPIGADPHDFQASSEQVALMSTADLVVSNGLFLEQGLVSILESLEADGAGVLELAERLDPLPFAEKSPEDHDDHGHSEDEAVEEEEEHAHGDFDPHFWLDMGRMALASELIGAELATTMGDETLAECGVTVAEEIRAAEAGVVATLASIPPQRRILVTDHESFGYFADSYDFRIVGVVVPGGSTLADPSSKDLAALVATIRSERVPAIFANTATSSAVAEAIAAEAGAGVAVVALFVESIGAPGSGAETYITMMQSNAALIAKALTD